MGRQRGCPPPDQGYCSRPAESERDALRGPGGGEGRPHVPWISQGSWPESQSGCRGREGTLRGGRCE